MVIDVTVMFLHLCIICSWLYKSHYLLRKNLEICFVEGDILRKGSCIFLNCIIKWLLEYLSHCSVMIYSSFKLLGSSVNFCYSFFFLIPAGTSCIGRGCLQSNKEARSMSQLQLQRQVQSPDWHLSCERCSTYIRSQQGVRLWWVNVHLSHRNVVMLCLT